MQKSPSNLKVAVITDLHYYSKALGVSGQAYERLSHYNQRLFSESEEVIQEAFRILGEDKDRQIIFIHGDLTNRGEVESHKELRELLRELARSGKRIFITYSTHDYNQSAHCYKGDKAIQIDAFSLEDIKHYYDEFGVNQSIAYHKDSGSYVAQLQDGYRLLALNDDFGNLKSGYTEECMQWIRKQVSIANKENQYIFAMAHHPIIPPTPLYKIIGKNDMIEQHELRVQQFSEMGINLYFTGHSHMNKIHYECNNRNIFYNVSTASMTGYPPTIRYIDIKNNSVYITTELINKIDGINTGNKTLSEFISHKFIGLIDDFLDSAVKGDMDRVKEIAGHISIKPYQIENNKFIIKWLSRRINKLSYRRLIKWTKRINGVNSKDYPEKLDNKVFPLIKDMVARLYDGKPEYTPDSLEYKLIMAMLAIVDSITKCLRIDINKKLGFSSISEIAEPLISNDSIDNYNVTLTLDNEQAIKLLKPHSEYKPPYTTNKGYYLVGLAIAGAIVLSPVLLPFMIIRCMKNKIKKLFSKS